MFCARSFLKRDFVSYPGYYPAFLLAKIVPNSLSSFLSRNFMRVVHFLCLCWGSGIGGLALAWRSLRNYPPLRRSSTSRPAYPRHTQPLNPSLRKAAEDAAPPARSQCGCSVLSLFGLVRGDVPPSKCSVLAISISEIFVLFPQFYAGSLIFCK